MITKYGITLKSLTNNEIAMITDWRNSPKIRSRMNNYEFQTYEKQLRWFKSLNKKENIFMVINIDNLPVGLIWVTDIYDTTQLGYYIYDDKYEHSPEATYAIKAFLEHLFTIPLVEQAYIEIDKKRKNEIRTLKYYGFEEGIYNSYLLSKDKFLQRRKELQEN